MRLPIHGKHTGRLVCKRWRRLIGESVSSLRATPQLLRTQVLGKGGTIAAAALGAQLAVAYPQAWTFVMQVGSSAGCCRLYS